MQWVETTGKTVEEAKGLALDQLGVADDDAEFEVLELPRTGLFGRVKGEAHVRARVKPSMVRQKPDRRDRKRGRDEGKSKHSSPKSEDAVDTVDKHKARTADTADSAVSTDGAPAVKQRKERQRRSTTAAESSSTSSQPQVKPAKEASAVSANRSATRRRSSCPS